MKRKIAHAPCRRRAIVRAKTSYGGGKDTHSLEVSFQWCVRLTRTYSTPGRVYMEDEYKCKLYMYVCGIDRSKKQLRVNWSGVWKHSKNKMNLVCEEKTLLSKSCTKRLFCAEEHASL